MTKQKEFTGKWKMKKKGLKWVWKKRKVSPLSISDQQSVFPAGSGHTTAPTTDGDARHAE